MIVMLKHNQDLWNADRDDEKSHMAAGIHHIDREEKRRSARRLRKETTRAMQQVDDCDDEDADFDLQGIQEDAIIGVYQLSLANNSRKRSRHKRLKLSFSFFAFFTNY